MKRGIARLAAPMLGASLTLARPAQAQQYLIGASGEVAAGIEGGGAGPTTMDLARARLRLGADLRVDEFPADIFGAALLIEILPHASFGIDARYMHAVGTRFELNIGGIAFLAPESLFGPSAGVKYKLPLSTATRLTFGPEANVFVIGSDLPSGTIIWQVLIQGGIHADL